MNFPVPQSAKDDRHRQTPPTAPVYRGDLLDSLLFDTIADPVLLFRYSPSLPASTIVEANSGAYSHLGYHRGDLPGLSLGSVIDHHERLAQHARRLREGRRITCRAVCRRKDGREMPVELQATLRSVRGTALLCIVCRDTRRRKRERKRFLRSAEYQSTLTSVARLALKEETRSALFDKTTRQTALTLDASCAGIFTRDTVGDPLRLTAGVGWTVPSNQSPTIPPNTGFQAGYTLQQETPLRVSCFEEETRFGRSGFLAKARIQSSLSIALSPAHDPCGIIIVGSRRRGHFSEEDEDFLQSIADVLSEALISTY